MRTFTTGEKSWRPEETKKTQRFSVLGLGLILCLSSGLFSGQDLTDFEKRLSKISEEIKGLRAKLKEEEKKEATILSTLDRIAYNKKLIRNEIAMCNVRLEKSSLELSEIRKKIPQLKTSLDKERVAIEKTIVTIYKFGKFDLLQLMLRADDMKTLFSESKRLSLLVRHQEDLLSGYLKVLEELRRNEEDLEAKKNEIARLIEDSNKKRRELEFREKENRILIEQIRKNKKTFEQTLSELSERSRQLEQMMKKLEKQEISFPFPFVPFYEKRGKLAWPVSGRITSRFGLQKHPRFNTTTMNNGIEIAPGKNDEVIRSIHAGKIVYVDYFQGYGNLIIVDHGMTYYSLYGHCSEFLVQKGEFVAAEQPIAVVGDSGSLQGTSLYLEIRYKTKPLDPLQWLRRR